MGALEPAGTPVGTWGLVAAICLCASVVCYALRRRLKFAIAHWLHEANLEYEWAQMPNRIILLRHGEAEHNLDHAAILQYENEDRKPDNLSELTAKGRQQAVAAGKKLRELLGEGATVSAIVSPFERTQQTLYCVQQELHGITMRCVHVDPRVREQEFGNYQKREEMTFHRETAHEVGRFWYRRPTGESGADVYDRAAAFWDDLFKGLGSPPEQHFAPSHERTGWTAQTGKADDALLVVTHGLTMRLLLMRYFQWSPVTFDAVYNPANADFWVLRKATNGARAYELAPQDCSPPCMPWATRQIRLIMRNRSPSEPATRDVTIVDYLSLPQPRTSHPEAALRLLLDKHGHQLDPSRAHTTPQERQDFIEATLRECIEVHPEDVESIDWWCGKISDAGKDLRRGVWAEKTRRRATLFTSFEKRAML